MAACRSFQKALELDHKNAQAQLEVGLLCSCERWGLGVGGRWVLERTVTHKAGLAVPLTEPHLADSRQTS